VRDDEVGDEAMNVWLVWGDDVGGNTGRIVLAVFNDEQAARDYALRSRWVQHNHAFDGGAGPPFTVEAMTLHNGLESALKEDGEG
jgi:hypothetical protein